jgi:hypothetical protein
MFLVTRQSGAVSDVGVTGASNGPSTAVKILGKRSHKKWNFFEI